MLVCPLCGADDIIEGDDQCAQCQQPLTDMFIRLPSSGVEADLLHDTVGDLPGQEAIELSADAPSATRSERWRIAALAA